MAQVPGAGASLSAFVVFHGKLAETIGLKMVSQAQFREMALSFPQAAEGSHFDVSDFRVRGKIFCTLREKDGRAVLKLEPDQQALLKETSAGLFEPAPGSWGLKGWTKAELERIDEDTLRHAMAMAWRSVAPKSLL